MGENEVFEQLQKDKEKLLEDMNNLLREFEKKHKQIQIHQVTHIKISGEDEDYTDFIRFTDVIMSFSLCKIKDRKTLADHSQESKKEKRG